MNNPRVMKEWKVTVISRAGLPLVKVQLHHKENTATLLCLLTIVPVIPQITTLMKQASRFR